MRDLLKTTARWLGLLLVIPWLVSFRIRASIFEPDRAILGSSQTLSLIPGLIGQYLRRAFFGRTLACFHPSATVEFGTLFSRTGARIDENVYIGPGCHIGLAHIGSSVLLGAGVHVPSGQRTHGTADLDQPIREQPGELRVVRIGEGSWIGSGAIVMADVGRDTVVAGGAVVTKRLPDRVVAGGVPAKIIRKRQGGDPEATD